MPSQLLLHRPDVQAAERQLTAANANITVARAQFLPSFNLTAEYGGQLMTIPSTGVSGPDSIYNLALNAVQPVFEGGRLQGGLAFARSRYAVHAFAVSLIGAIMSLGSQYIGTPPPPEMTAGAMKYVPLVIIGICAALLWYSWRQDKSGVLR